MREKAECIPSSNTREDYSRYLICEESIHSSNSQTMYDTANPSEHRNVGTIIVEGGAFVGKTFDIRTSGYKRSKKLHMSVGWIH